MIFHSSLFYRYRRPPSYSVNAPTGLFITKYLGSGGTGGDPMSRKTITDHRIDRIDHTQSRVTLTYDVFLLSAYPTHTRGE